MRQWTVWLATATVLACAERAGKGPANRYGETPAAVVVRVWVADSPYDMEFVRAADTSRDLRLGKSRTWPLGAASMGVSPQPQRPDYYRVFPGEGWAVASERPGPEAVQYDIYAAVRLDRAVPDSVLHSAAALQTLSREAFAIPAEWTLDSIPGGEALQDQVSLSGTDELALFSQNPDGTYPRVLLVAMNVTAPLRAHSAR